MSSSNIEHVHQIPLWVQTFSLLTLIGLIFDKVNGRELLHNVSFYSTWPYKWLASCYYKSSTCHVPCFILEFSKSFSGWMSFVIIISSTKMIIVIWSSPSSALAKTVRYEFHSCNSDGISEELLRPDIDANLQRFSYSAPPFGKHRLSFLQY